MSTGGRGSRGCGRARLPGSDPVETSGLSVVGGRLFALRASDPSQRGVRVKWVARFLGFGIPVFLVGVAGWDWFGLRTWGIAVATEWFVGVITQSLT